MSGHTYLLYPAVLAVCAGIWYQLVNNTVHEPYLDEFFHIHQAQVYCTGNLTHWDPKITTPPGLYLLSYLLDLAGQGCSIPTLRQTNASAIFFTWIPLYLLLRQQYAQQRQQSSKTHAAHTAMNICLFPPLFFFSALYYTDVVSTEVVLWCLYLRGNERLKRVPVWRGVVLVATSVVALLFRQTNVFWIAVFSGGLDAVEVVRQKVARRQGNISNGAPQTFLGVLRSGWEGTMLYDVPVADAYFEDYILTTLSLALTILCNLLTTLQAILPQLTILALFGLFVIWNGGVVLGDKSNHVATIHTPQLLYLWPYILFFSLPVVLAVLGQRYLATGLRGSSTAENQTPASPQLSLPTHHNTQLYITTRILLFLTLTALALAAIHHNTIIHPFTLADNRHYIFYIFKLFRLYPAIKYLAAPMYIVCAWSSLNALGTSNHAASSSVPTSAATGASPIDKKTNETGQSPLSIGGPDEATPGTTFVLIWLATTTLTLITAPLVEPRYYIIPWVVWRVHVFPPPASPLSPQTVSTVSTATAASSSKQKQKSSVHVVLWTETAWLILLNVVTGYIFLYRGFEWVQEAGVVQRFLW